jgi:hypothetical protein
MDKILCGFPVVFSRIRLIPLALKISFPAVLQFHLRGWPRAAG